MKKPIIYLCGPMTGLPDDNRPAFFNAEDALRDAGYPYIVNPARNGLRPESPWLSHMRADIANMVTVCDAVATLPGCEASRGAVIEIGLATGLGWPVRTVEQWIRIAVADSLKDPQTDGVA